MQAWEKQEAGRSHVVIGCECTEWMKSDPGHKTTTPCHSDQLPGASVYLVRITQYSPIALSVEDQLYKHIRLWGNFPTFLRLGLLLPFSQPSEAIPQPLTASPKYSYFLHLIREIQSCNTSQRFNSYYLKKQYLNFSLL